MIAALRICASTLAISHSFSLHYLPKYLPLFVIQLTICYVYDRRGLSIRDRAFVGIDSVDLATKTTW